MADHRGRLHILVEGQTEETIARDVLEPYLREHGWWVSYSIVKTKRPAVGPAQAGGLSNWARLATEIRNLLRDTNITVLTTLLDYYGFPTDAPGMNNRPTGSAYDRVTHVETEIAKEIADQRFLPHLVLHELEAWVFAAHTELGDLYGDTTLAAKLRHELDESGGAELVDDGPATAPSKRLLRHRPDYMKVTDGPLAVSELGVPRLRAACPHVDEWLKKLEG